MSIIHSFPCSFFLSLPYALFILFSILNSLLCYCVILIQKALVVVWFSFNWQMFDVNILYHKDHKMQLQKKEVMKLQGREKKEWKTSEVSAVSLCAVIITSLDVQQTAEACSTTEDGDEPLHCPTGYECHIINPGNPAAGIPNRGQCIKQRGNSGTVK